MFMPIENMCSTVALEGMRVLYLMNNSLRALLGKASLSKVFFKVLSKFFFIICECFSLQETLEEVSVFLILAVGLVQDLEQFILHVMVMVFVEIVVFLTAAAAWAVGAPKFFVFAFITR